MIPRKVPTCLAKSNYGNSNVKGTRVPLMIRWVCECMWGRVGGPKDSQPPPQVSDPEWSHLIFSISLCREIQAHMGKPQPRPKGSLLLLLGSTLASPRGSHLFQAPVVGVREWCKGGFFSLYLTEGNEGLKKILWRSISAQVSLNSRHSPCLDRLAPLWWDTLFFFFKIFFNVRRTISLLSYLCSFPVPLSPGPHLSAL